MMRLFALICLPWEIGFAIWTATMHLVFIPSMLGATAILTMLELAHGGYRGKI
jgi:hypothetical protein